MAEAAMTNPDEQALARIMARIEELGLEKNLVELETLGYTTIPGVLNGDVVARARQAIRRRVETETGKSIDLETANEADFSGMTYVPYLLYDDEVFEEILMAPEPLALITYLLGESCVLSSIGSHFKGIGEHGVVPLHSDNGFVHPSPFPAYSLVSNVNYALTPYSKEAGALALVPRSHQWARQPTMTESSLSGESANPNAIAMGLEPGDAVVWHGNAWHGSFPRQIPGIRMNLAVYFARHYVVTQERHKDVVPAEVLDRHANDDRFKVLVAGNQAYGWQHDGPDYAKMAKGPRGLYD